MLRSDKEHKNEEKGFATDFLAQCEHTQQYLTLAGMCDVLEILPASVESQIAKKFAWYNSHDKKLWILLGLVVLWPCRLVESDLV